MSDARTHVLLVVGILLAGCAGEPTLRTEASSADTRLPLDAAPTLAQPEYWRFHFEEILPDESEAYEQAMRDIVAAQRAAGVPMEVAGWYAMSLAKGGYLNLSPVSSISVLGAGQARRAELHRLVGESFGELEDALHSTLLRHRSDLLRPLPEFSLNLDRPGNGPPPYVHIVVEWPRLHMLDQYLTARQKIHDVCRVTGYPLKVRAYRGVFSQWDYVYLYEAESRDAYLSGSSFHPS